MKSTGEVYGSDVSADHAYLKARLATEVPVATSEVYTSQFETKTKRTIPDTGLG